MSGKDLIAYLDKFEIDITCEKCGNVTKKTIGWVKCNSHITCACGTYLSLNSERLASAIAEINGYLSQFCHMKK